MALKKVKGNFERMFDKNLTDLVRGIRNNKDNEGKYITQCMEEIKIELRTDNIAVKANAVAKLTYLEMLGYDISWAVFNIIEVMSSTKFTYKRIGYLAAGQSFHADSELLMLTTNMIRKDLNSQNQYEAGLALSGLSCFINYDLARDLANDIMTLMSSTKPYLRMKAVLMMYKVFLRYPDALRPAFPKLKEKLEDPDPGVQSAAVNVVCELARKNPKNYLSLAPIFFKLMTTSTNNWMLIKIIKLFGALTPLEPRLGRKLIEPLTNLIDSTSAMSLLYECVNTVIAVLISISSGQPGFAGSVQLCVQKLRILIEDTDQNLKYLGLLAMSRILKTHPKSVQAHKDLVLQCLDDKDESIRLRALDLLYGMVSKKNLMEIVKKLMTHMERAEGTLYRDELLTKMIEICSQNSYQHVTDFKWFVTVIVELIEMETGAKHGEQLGNQLMEIGVRVVLVRSFIVKECGSLVRSAPSAGPSTRTALYHAAYLLAEYAEEPSDMIDYIKSLLLCSKLDEPAAPVCVHNAFKLTVKLMLHYLKSGEKDKILEVCQLTCDGVGALVSAEGEVQQRAVEVQAMLALLLQHCKDNQQLLEHRPENGETMENDEWLHKYMNELENLFEGELRPVAPKAQRKVPMPPELNLDDWITLGTDSDSSASDGEEGGMFTLVTNEHEAKPQQQHFTSEEMHTMREARRAEQANNPHYLKDDSPRGYQTEDIPIAEIALEVPLHINMKRSDKYLMALNDNKKNKKSKEKKRSKKHKRTSKKVEKDSTSSESEQDEIRANMICTGGEMPEGAESDDEDKPADDPHAALDQDLEEPLQDYERLPVKTYNLPDLNEPVFKLKSNDKTHSKDSKKPEKSRKKKKKDRTGEKSKRTKEPVVDLMIDINDSLDRTIDSNHKENSLDIKKVKKTKKCDKEKESRKKDKTTSKVKDSKKGYEEAIGISTPSKEVI